MAARERSTVRYNFTCKLTERANCPLFGVKFNHRLKEPYFATVGGPKATIYKCGKSGHDALSPVCLYEDEDALENYYCCEWVRATGSKDSWLAIAGAKGIIRIIDTCSCQLKKSFGGHGSAVNELVVSPADPHLLLSASKDHSLRLWNMLTDTCVLIMSGVDGHRDEVLSCDFSKDGKTIYSAGMDHTVKVWNIGTDDIQDIIEAGSLHTYSQERNFKTHRIHFPVLSSRSIHSNYADCIRCVGNMVLSKSCENQLVFWRPIPKGTEYVARQDSFPLVAQPLFSVDAPNTEVWFLRFTVNMSTRLLTLGTQTGKILLWDLSNFVMNQNPRLVKSIVLSQPSCTTTVRQTAFSSDSECLVAVSDSGEVWRWDRQ